jgi:predicted transcriptional regulator
MKNTNFIILLIICLILLIILLYSNEAFKEYITSTINNKKYAVQDDLPNYEAVPNKLATIEQFIKKFKSHLESKLPNDKRVKRLLKRLKNINIEESELKEGVSSFTVNKGELISVCVRDKENHSEFHNHQLLLFVIIHELAHIASESFGHNNEFNTNFKWLLHEAQNVGYTPVDYSINPVTYCGVNVTNNPIM